MLKTSSQEISGWGNLPRQQCLLLRPEKMRDFFPRENLVSHPTCIARGLGKSYGDASLNQNGLVILTERLNRFIKFDRTKGILSTEAGVTLNEILTVIIPKGWFLPVTPGTKQLTIGGCVAADVHGKNHHHAGSFGNYVLSLEIRTADGENLHCSASENTDLFWATIGGMGLTGLISSVTLQLIPITTTRMNVKHHMTHDLSSTFQRLTEESYDDTYSVAWIDVQRKRGIVMTSHHTCETQINTVSNDSSLSLSQYQSRSRFSLPFYLPSGFLNNTFINTFNAFYFKQQSKKINFTTSIDAYFYPLDNLHHWNKLYGKKGFVQFQCAFSHTNAFEAIHSLITTLSQKHVSFLSVLKRLGSQSAGLLSFPMKGFTLALDLPYKGKETVTLLEKLEKMTLDYEGRIYLAKDAHLSAEGFRAMYPNLEKFLKIKKQFDPDNIFQSSLSRRLKIYS